MFPRREPYRTIFKIFNFFGFWNELSKWHKRFATSLMIICTIGYALVITLPIFQQNELIGMLDGLKISFMLLLVIVNLYDFVRKKSKVCEMLELIDELESNNPESGPYFKDAFKLIQNIFLIEAAFVIILFVFFVATPLILHKLMFPTYIPDIIKDYEVTFYIYWMFENVSGLYSASTYVPIQEFRCSLLIILNNYVEFFRDKLHNLYAIKENSQEAAKELVECVKIHHQIMRFMDIYKDTFELSLATLIIVGAFFVCSNAFVIAISLLDEGFQANSFSILYQIFILCVLFIPCYHSNTIQYQCDNFLYDLFSSEWLESDVKYKKLMIIFMENLKKNVIFTIAGFIDVNLQLFIDIINFTYSLYCVLQSLD